MAQGSWGIGIFIFQALKTQEVYFKKTENVRDLNIKYIPGLWHGETPPKLYRFIAFQIAVWINNI